MRAFEGLKRQIYLSIDRVNSVHYLWSCKADHLSRMVTVSHLDSLGTNGRFYRQSRSYLYLVSIMPSSTIIFIIK